jgi:hypothetical protein
MAQNRFHTGKGAEDRGEELSIQDFRRMMRNQNTYSPPHMLKSSESRSLLKSNSKKQIIEAQKSYDSAIDSYREAIGKKPKKHKKSFIDIPELSSAKYQSSRNQLNPINTPLGNSVILLSDAENLEL